MSPNAAGGEPGCVGVGAIVGAIDGGAIDQPGRGNDGDVGTSEDAIGAVWPVVAAEVSRLLAGTFDGTGLAQAQHTTATRVATAQRRIVNATLGDPYSFFTRSEASTVELTPPERSEGALSKVVDALGSYAVQAPGHHLAAAA